MKRIIQFGSLGILLFIAAAWFNSTRAGSATVEPSAADALPVEVIAEHGVGDGHPATEVPIGRVADLATDLAGNIYFVDAVHLRVRRIDPDGIIDTVLNGHSLDIPSSPRAVAVDEKSGALYVADDSANRVWLIRNGTVEGFAGTGAYGLSGDGGPATEAQLHFPVDLAVGHDGTVYIADIGNHRIRAVTGDGTIWTLAGDLPPNIDVVEAWSRTSLFQPELIAGGADGSLYVADRKRRRVQRILADGSAEELPFVEGTVTGLAVAADGTLLMAGAGFLFEARDGVLVRFAEFRASSFTVLTPQGSNVIAYDWRAHRLYRVGPEGSKKLIAGNGTAGRFGDGGPAHGATFTCYDVVVTTQGEIAFSDPFNRRIALIRKDGNISTLVRAEQGLGQPLGIATDSGALYIADAASHRVLKLGAGGLSVVAGNGVAGFAGDGGPATQASLNAPRDVSVAESGEILISDNKNQRVRCVDPSGNISTFAALTTRPESLSVDRDGNVVITSRSGAELLPAEVPNETVAFDTGAAGQNGHWPTATAFGPKGQLLWASGGVLLAASAGKADTILAPLPKFALPVSVPGMAASPDGDLVMCDGLHQRILRISAATLETAVAGVLGP